MEGGLLKSRALKGENSAAFRQSGHGGTGSGEEVAGAQGSALPGLRPQATAAAEWRGHGIRGLRPASPPLHWREGQLGANPWPCRGAYPRVPGGPA